MLKKAGKPLNSLILPQADSTVGDQYAVSAIATPSQGIIYMYCMSFLLGLILVVRI